MTAQLPDTVDHRGTELTLARARGTGLRQAGKGATDPELEKLTEEIADCSQRVFTPAPGPAGSTSPP